MCGYSCFFFLRVTARVVASINSRSEVVWSSGMVGEGVVGLLVGLGMVVCG